jgi:hypothetical protein
MPAPYAPVPAEMMPALTTVPAPPAVVPTPPIWMPVHAAEIDAEAALVTAPPDDRRTPLCCWPGATAMLPELTTVPALFRIRTPSV